MVKILFNIYYDSKLNSGCNLGKNLSKDREDNQLVKHKDIGIYLQLYILTDYKKTI